MRIPKMRDDRPTMAELLLLVKLPDTVMNLSRSMGTVRQRIYQLGISCQRKGWVTRVKRGRYIRLQLTSAGETEIRRIKKMIG